MIKVLYDILNEQEIESLLKEYYDADSYNTESMKKVAPGPATKIIDDLIYGYKRVGGNYYQHFNPYLPHTDHREEWGSSINVVVPLHADDPTACLVVFDQCYNKDSVTWCLHFDVQQYQVNTGVLGRPFDYKDVIDLTNQPISDELYEKLKWSDRDQWFGLTGKALEFKPGNILIFDNNHIHTTGIFKGIKTGLSLRYKL